VSLRHQPDLAPDIDADADADADQASTSSRGRPLSLVIYGRTC
jgi:hypothetical protein